MSVSPRTSRTAGFTAFMSSSAAATTLASEAGAGLVTLAGLGTGRAAAFGLAAFALGGAATLFFAGALEEAFLAGDFARLTAMLTSMAWKNSTRRRTAIATGGRDDLADRIGHEITRVATGGDQPAHLGRRDLHLRPWMNED